MSSGVHEGDEDAVTARRRQLRQFFAGVVLYSQAVADRLGIGASDLHCLNVLALSGPVTAGQLSRMTGLTSGAVTRLVDRLESLGLVARGHDPDDRRRVMVRPAGNGRTQVAPLFVPIGRRMAAVLETMSDDERHAVDRFIRECNPLLREETAAFREETAALRTAADSRPCAPD